MFSSFFFCGGGWQKASPVVNFFDSKDRRFDSSLIIAIKKCRFNHAQVILCKPFGKNFRQAIGFRPFPTSFWLVCPHLIKLAGKIESQGGVKELENFLTRNNLQRQWHEYNFSHQVLRLRLMNKNSATFMRNFHGKIFRPLMRGGVGGIHYDTENVNVKCLHLQTASFIALGHHPGEKWLRSKGLCPGIACDKAEKSLC